MSSLGEQGECYSVTVLQGYIFTLSIKEICYINVIQKYVTVMCYINMLQQCDT